MKVDVLLKYSEMFSLEITVYDLWNMYIIL